MDTKDVSTGADRPSGAEPEGDVRTFLIVDVRGYTPFTQAFGDEEAGKLAAQFAGLARESIAGAGGEVVELRGDEALCVFRSARQAIRAAVELQTRFRERVDGKPVFPLGIGVGLDAGEAVPVEGGYRGGALNLASRLCSLAAPGQILASETVTSLARTVEGVRFVDRRRAVRVKGLEKKVRVIEVVPEIELPPVPDALAGRARRRRRGLLLMAVGTVVLAAAVAAGVLLNRDGSAEAIAGSGVSQLDPATGEVLDTIPLGTAPSTVAVGEGAAWVIDANDQTVSRIATSNPGDPQTFSTGSTPTDIAVGVGAVWVTNLGSNVLPESVSRLDPESRTVVETIDLPPKSLPENFWGGGGATFSRQHIAVTRDAVWAINPDLTVSRIDPRTNSVVARVEGVQALNIAAGDGGVWLVDGIGDGAFVAEIDPETNAVRRTRVLAQSLTTLAVGDGAVWVADPFGGSVWRIDADPDGAVPRQIPLDTWVSGVAFGDGAVWATNEIADKVYRIDPRTNRARVVGGIAGPRGVAVGEGAAWVTTAGPPSADAALPASACSSVFYGGEGEPQFLLGSDLILQGDSTASTRSLVEGIRFSLEQRGFEAGRYTVGYQSCDSSTPSGAADQYRCVVNAKSYARNLEVIGEIGAWNSYCSYLQIPVANEAPQGPLAMISPSNTYTPLTRGEDQYPSGERNFVRIAAADHLLAVAEVELAKELGAKSVFLLGDFDNMHVDARKAARNLGLEVTGAASWNPEARDFASLARRIARTRPEAVAIFGLYEENEGELIRDLRAALGPDVPLVANDGFNTSEGLVKAAGPAARGIYYGRYGLPDTELPPAGERFLEEFEAAQGGEPTPWHSATYGAQAVEILLDAIARSDGTRASVNRELRRTTVENGILGDIRFDENGDLVEGPVSFFRVVGREASPTILAGTGVGGLAFDRVIMARVELLD
jgi:branched-chain amino acid transport system substrate-binding protein